MAFKGTRKRKAFHILNRLESLGGELNAFTDKEKILFSMLPCVMIISNVQ